MMSLLVINVLITYVNI